MHTEIDCSDKMRMSKLIKACAVSFKVIHMKGHVAQIEKIHHSGNYEIYSVKSHQAVISRHKGHSFRQTV